MTGYNGDGGRLREKAGDERRERENLRENIKSTKIKTEKCAQSRERWRDREVEAPPQTKMRGKEIRTDQDTPQTAGDTH